MPQQPTTLAEYYASKGQSLPGWRDRAPIFEQAGLGSASNYTGTASQNVALLDYFLTKDTKAGGQAPTPTGEMGEWIDPKTGVGYSGIKKDPSHVARSDYKKPSLTPTGEMGEWVDPTTGVGYSGAKKDPSHISKSDYDASRKVEPSVGAGVGGQAGGGQVDQEAEAKRIAEENRKQQEADAEKANAAANKIFENLGDTKTGDDADTRKSADILKKLEDIILEEDEDKPEAPNLVDLFNQKKAELGLDALEIELADIDTEIERLDAQLLIDVEKQEGRMVSRGTVSAKKTQIAKEAKFNRALLQIDRNAVARIASNKLTTLKMVMDLTQQDFANASDSYEQDYKKTLQLYSLFLGAETSEQNRVDRAKNDARANITLIHNALKAAGSTYSSLTPDQQRQLTELETQAGIPSGYSEAILSATESDDKIVAYKWSDDETQVTAIVQKPDGTITTITQSTGLPAVGDDDKDKTEAEQQRAAVQDMSTQLNSIKGGDGFISPEDWKKAKKAWSEEGFDGEAFIKQFFHFINPDEPRGVSAYGSQEQSYILYGS